MKNIAVNKTVQVFMVSFFLFTIKLNAQSDLLYGGGRINSLDTKEQKKIKRGQLYKNDVWNKNAVDSLYDKFISNSKKIKFEFGADYGFVLAGKYNYETYINGFKFEAKDVELKTNTTAAFKFNVYWPLVKNLNLLTGTTFGIESFKVETATKYGSKYDENMNTVNWSANLGLMYNPKSFLIHNYFQLGTVFGPSSGFFGNVTGIGWRSGNNLYSFNYRYSGGSLVEVTQKSEFAEKERTYQADAIFFTASFLALKLSNEEKAAIAAVNAKYKANKDAILAGTYGNQYLNTAPPFPPPPPAEGYKINASIYKDVSDSTLSELLQMALKKEEYEKADIIQQEIKKRTQQNKYAKTSDEELKALLENALKIEDYNTAEIIQLEIDKRANSKKDTKGKTSSPTKKTLKELEDDLKKAMDAEDYKKADEIQKEINKLK
jgi:protein-arginine kinase activator protein McsA